MELDLEDLKNFVNSVESLLLSVRRGDLNSRDVLALRSSLLEQCEHMNDIIIEAEAA